jgi:hypothetical protein
MKYEDFEGVSGLKYKIFFKNGFTPKEDIFSRKESPEKSTKKSKDLKKSRSKDKSESARKKISLEFFKGIFSLIRQEEELFKKIIFLLFKFLRDLIYSIKIDRIDGTFHVKDPYYCGLYYAFLGPLCRNSFCLLPNFTGENLILAEVRIIPGEIIVKILMFLISLPVIRMYRVYREFKRL